MGRAPAGGNAGAKRFDQGGKVGQIIINYDERLYADTSLSPEQILWWEMLRRDWGRTIRPFSAEFFDATDHGQVFHKATAIPPHLLTDAKLVWGRESVLDLLPKGGVAAEIGVLKGYFSQQILRRAAPRQLHLFDLDFAPLLAAEAFQYQNDPRLVFHQGDSSITFAQLADASLDYLGLDGNHSRAAVERDLQLAAEKIRPGGWIQLNDYTPFCYMHLQPYGVMHAVNRFLAERQWPVVCLALHPLGYHDLVISRPR